MVSPVRTVESMGSRRSGASFSFSRRNGMKTAIALAGLLLVTGMTFEEPGFELKVSVSGLN